MSIRLFIITIFISSCISLRAQNEPKPPVIPPPPPPYKVELVKKKTVSDTSRLRTIKITSLKDCLLRIDGEYLGEFKAKSEKILTHPLASHLKVEAAFPYDDSHIYECGYVVTPDYMREAYCDYTQSSSIDVVAGPATEVGDPDVRVMASGGQPEADTDKVFMYVEQMPEYPGGSDKMRAYIASHINYPQAERDNKIEGKVFLTFVVDTMGAVYDVKVIKGISPGLDKEAKRVASLLRFKPGKQNGKTVKVKFTLPVSFKLE